MKSYIKRTWKNKLAAVAMAILGYLSTFVDGDGTGFVFALMISAVIFFQDEK